MYNFLVKNGQLAAFGLGLLITVIFFFGAAGSEDPERFNFGLYTSIGLAILCAVAMVAFGLFHVASNPKGSLKGIITFVVLLALFGVLYAMATTGEGGRMPELMQKFNVNEGISKFISAAITTTLALIVVALVTFAFSEIRNFFK